MALINPNLVETKKVTELPDLALALGNFFAHCGADGVLGKVDINDLAEFLSPYIAAIGGAGFVPVSGTVLPNPVSGQVQYSIVGLDTYTWTGGSLTTVQPINVVASNGTTWSIVVPIPIDLSGYVNKNEIVDYLKIDKIIQLGKNLADPSTKILDKFVAGGTGVITTNVNYNLYRINTLTPSTLYYRSHTYQMAYFDVNGIFISGDTASTGVPGTFTTPSNIRYALFSVLKTNESAFMVMIDSNPDKTYEPYTESIKSSWGLLKNINLAPFVSDDQLFSSTVNKFNKLTIVLDKFINSTTGAENTGVTYVSSDYIKVLPSTQYTRSHQFQMAYYDINKVYISGLSISDGLSGQFTPPYNAYYARFSILKTALATFQVVVGGSLPAYTTFTGFIKDSLLAPVTIAKTNFITAGNNLFNINDADIALGMFVNNTTGALNANASYNSTGYMKVVGGQSYSLSYKHNIAWYDINKTYISGSSSTDTNKTQVAPATAFYLRATVLATLWTQFMANLGASVLPYEPYNYVLKDPNGVPIKTGSYAALECCLPSKTYVLKSNENSIYFDQVTNKLKYESQSARISGGGYLNLDKLARVTNPTVSGTTNMQIYNEDFEVILTETTSVQIGDPATNNGAITLNSMGDSYTYNGAWQSIIRTKIPAITFTGMRRPYTDSLLRNEGRGGWTLNLYFTQLHSTTDSFTPFMHPTGYLYYGNTDFWTKVVTNNVTYPYEGFNPIAVSIGFTAGGFKTTPAVNDLMYDDGASTYKYWNGSAWTTISLTAGDFSFNYTKYRQAWGIAAPTFFSSMLGVNDFFSLTSKSAVESFFPTWKTQMDIVIASVKSDTPTAKILIMPPVINYGLMDNIGGIFTKMNRYITFYGRRLIIDTYDLRESELIYVVDGGACVDPEYGYNYQNIIPFSLYIGTEMRKTIENTPHPSIEGYKQLGLPVAACIQRLR